MINYKNNKADGLPLSPVRFFAEGLIQIKQLYACFMYLGARKMFRAFCLFFRRCCRIATKATTFINEDIRDKEIRVVGPDGEQLGIMPTVQAMRMAEEKNLDLVKIAPQAKPPVCKIMDYGKFRFEQSKREKDARKNQHVVDTKEIKLSLNIDTHDLETKVGHARKFLAAGNKVKVSIRMRGREMAYPARGVEIMEKFAEYCQDLSSIEHPPKLESRIMLMFLTAKTNK